MPNLLKPLALTLAFVVLLSGCGTKGDAEITLDKTAKIYVLTGEDKVLLMPTVTLFENGTARLSQPPISSLALVGTGRYEIDGRELTVSYGENASSVFWVSDDGDTLTLKATNLAHAKIGSVYKSRSEQR